MARFKPGQADQVLEKGGAFFKLNDGDKVSVRFLYNTIDDIEELTVHEFSGKNFATIDCARQSEQDSKEVCKWCMMDNPTVGRVVLPIYNVEADEIQYWKRSVTWVRQTLYPVFENLPPNTPISGQLFIIGRTGTTIQDTKYTVAPDMRVMNDGKLKDAFGEVKDGYELNMIRPNDYDFDPSAGIANDSNDQAVKRTANIF